MSGEERDDGWPRGFWWALLDWTLYLSPFAVYVGLGMCVGEHRWGGVAVLGLVSAAFLQEDRAILVRHRKLDADRSAVSS